MSTDSPDWIAPDWIAIDWGTSNLRAWAMVDDRPVAQASAPVGMGNLARDEFEPALTDAVGHWLDAGRKTQVVACGMVGARQGWQEVPYAQVPCPPLVTSAMGQVEAGDPRLAVTIVHGLSQMSPPDVMRGEETQIAGLLALEPGFDGLACLPGTHSKWASVAAGRVEHFRTFMTGEMFALLATQSVLRHSVGAQGEERDEAFAEAVAEIGDDPAALSTLLFAIRASGLVGTSDPVASRARLSGLLIGFEMEAMRREWRDRPVVLIGAGPLCEAYRMAIELRGGSARLVEAEACTLAGLIAARNALGETP